jgi:Zn-dependent peptidase ImmA (M78 family)
MIDVEGIAWQYGRVLTVPMPDGLQGAYDLQTGTIYTSNQLSDDQRRCVLAHEISHARHRDLSCSAGGYSERRADREAAVLLIDPTEYASAEVVNDNEVWLARELSVMPYLIRAYRQLLHDKLNPVLAVL